MCIREQTVRTCVVHINQIDFDPQKHVRLSCGGGEVEIMNWPWCSRWTRTGGWAPRRPWAPPRCCSKRTAPGNKRVDKNGHPLSQKLPRNSITENLHIFFWTGSFYPQNRTGSRQNIHNLSRNSCNHWWWKWSKMTFPSRCWAKQTNQFFLSKSILIKYLFTFFLLVANTNKNPVFPLIVKRFSYIRTLLWPTVQTLDRLIRTNFSLSIAFLWKWSLSFRRLQQGRFFFL